MTWLGRRITFRLSGRRWSTRTVPPFGESQHDRLKTTERSAPEVGAAVEEPTTGGAGTLGVPVRLPAVATADDGLDPATLVGFSTPPALRLLCRFALVTD